MVRLMTREAMIILLAGLFARYAVPGILRVEAYPSLFWVGIFMGLSYMSMYALGVLTGNKLPQRMKSGAAVLSWALAFLPGLWLGPGLPAFGFAAWGALRPRALTPLQGGIGALFAYSFPLLGVRWLLLPLLSGNETMAGIALYTGAAYMSMRSGVRLLWPGSVEGDPTGRPLVNRPVPDAVVGLVEAAARRGARPFLTAPDGTRDDGGISVLARPAEAEAVANRVRAQLGEAQFDVAVGVTLSEKTEITVRPRQA